MATPTPQTRDIIDEYLSLPEEYLPLCSAINDDDTLSEGQMRFVLSSEVLDYYRTIVDALEISRGLPENDHAATIQVSDPVVLFIVQNDPELKTADENEKSRLARDKAAGWYQKQKKQVESDALFIAMSRYNELNIVPIPYTEGEIAFRIQGEGEPTREGSRKQPSWELERAHYEIPLPERRLGNLFERRLKQLYQLVNACGGLWTSQFRGVYERGLIKTIQLAEPRDEDSFPAKPARRKVHAKSGSQD